MQLKHIKEIVCRVSDICRSTNIMDINIIIPDLVKEGITIKTNGKDGIGTNVVFPIFPELPTDKIEQKKFMKEYLDDYSKMIYDYEEDGEYKSIEVFFRKK